MDNKEQQEIALLMVRMDQEQAKQRPVISVQEWEHVMTPSTWSLIRGILW